jgi:hypothetical protein
MTILLENGDSDSHKRKNEINQTDVWRALKNKNKESSFSVTFTLYVSIQRFHNSFGKCENSFTCVLCLLFFFPLGVPTRHGQMTRRQDAFTCFQDRGPHAEEYLNLVSGFPTSRGIGDIDPHSLP